MENKEIMDKLAAYFITQDPAVIARLAASLLIDINRIWHVENLQEEEMESLVERMEINLAQLNEFILNGPQQDLKIIVRNSS